jgi:hypothetical protein
VGALPLHFVAIALALLATSCGAETHTQRESDEEWHSLRDAQAGISVRYPPGWDATSRALTEVVWPPHRLAIASFPLDEAGVDPDCSPTTVIARLPGDGAFIILFEYTEGAGDQPSWTKDVPGRPAHFELESSSFANYECFGPSYKVQFVEHGRSFQAHISFGDEATGQTRTRALDALDSLKIAPSP